MLKNAKVLGGNEKMRRAWSLTGLLLIALGGFASVCATSIYQKWDAQLQQCTRRYCRMDDVSLLIGAPPSRCDAIKDPQPGLGLLLSDPNATVVGGVRPNGPASEAGIRPGDSIQSVGGQSVVNASQFISAAQANMREGQPLTIETSRGSLVVIPKPPAVAEQCYWDVQAGGVARAGSSTFVNPYFGSRGTSATAYQRFYRASCRILDGFLAG